MTYAPPSKKQITLVIDADLHTRLKAIAPRQGMTEFCRNALTACVTQLENTLTPQAK